MTIIHVLPQEIRYGYDSVDAIQPDIPSTPVKGIVELSKQEVQAKWLNKIIEKAKEMDVNLQTDIIVATRSVAAEIVDYADKLDADLIIARNKGQEWIETNVAWKCCFRNTEICRLSCTNSKVSNKVLQIIS